MRSWWEDESLPYRASREELVRAEANIGAGPR